MSENPLFAKLILHRHEFQPENGGKITILVTSSTEDISSDTPWIIKKSLIFEARVPSRGGAEQITHEHKIDPKFIEKLVEARHMIDTAVGRHMGRGAKPRELEICSHLSDELHFCTTIRHEGNQAMPRLYKFVSKQDGAEIVTILSDIVDGQILYTLTAGI